MSTPQRDEILVILRRHKMEFADRYGVTSLGIFGSVARGDADENSDIDIVYETSAPHLFRTVRMKLELEALFGRRVDVVRRRESMNPRLKARISREALYA